jgi:hypothetical protein
MARVPTQIMKWALLYAIQAARAQVTSEDLARATLVGTYLMDTAKLVPGMVEKTRVSRVEAKIVETLRKVDGKYLTANEIHRVVSGRVKADELKRSLDALVNLQVIEAGNSPNGAKAYKFADRS